MSMGELLTFSVSSLLLPPKYNIRRQVGCYNPRSLVFASQRPVFAASPLLCPTLVVQKRLFVGGIRAGVISDSKTPTTFTADSAGEVVDVLPDTGVAGDGFGNPSGGNGNGGRGDGNNGGRSGGDSGESKGERSKKPGLSMSQKLTLAYAILVAVGGLVGYLKGGSQKSLLTGGLSAGLLYFVYTLLPTKPVLASSLGLGVSAALLAVMGPRFQRSGKIFPAGVLSIVSFIMSAGYLHGIIRSGLH